MRSKSRTSVEILEERNALQERVLDLELALAKMNEEIEHALRHPEIQFLTLCRIGALVRAAAPAPIDTDDEVPGPPLSKTRPIAPPASTRECG